MKKYLTGIFAFILMFTFISSVSAKGNVEISNVSISDKKDIMVANIKDYNELTLNTKESFYEVGDFVTYNITIKNTTGKSLSVDKISDSINNEYIETSYNYDKKEIKNNEEYSFDITLKYKKEITDNSTKFNLPINIVIDYTNGSSTRLLVNPDTKDNVLIYFIIFVLSAISLVLFKTKKKKLLVFIIALGLVPSIAYAASNKITITMNNEIGIYKRLAIMDTGVNVNRKLKELAGTDTTTNEDPTKVIDVNIKHIVRARELPSNITLTDNNKISISDSVVPIYAWFNNGTLYYYTEADTIYLNEDSERLFINLSKVEDIDMSIFDTSNVTTIRSMFYGCESLKTIDVSNFDTTNVTSMRTMFYNCKNLAELNLNNFNTSNVTDMRSMFNRCSGLKELNVSNFDTSNVTTIRSMFYGCEELKSIDLSNFNTSNVTDMTAVFYGCSSLSELNIDNFDTLNVTDISYMFSNTNFKNIDFVSKFDTSNVTNMSGTFGNMFQLEDISALENWNVSNVTNLDSFLMDSRSLIDFSPLSKWDTSNVTSMRFTFGLNPEPQGGRKKDNAIIDLSPLKDWNTSNVTNMYCMFQNYNIKSFEVFENWNVSKVENFSYMFNQTAYSQVKTLHGLENWDVSSAKEMEGMFFDGAKFEDASAINDWDVRNVTNFYDMFKTNHIIHPEFTKVSGTWENGTFIKNS